MWVSRWGSLILCFICLFSWILGWIFFFLMLLGNILSLSSNQLSWTFGDLILTESFLPLHPLNKEKKSTLNSDIFILVFVLLTTLKVFQLGLLHHLMDNHCSQNRQIVPSLTCYAFVNKLLLLVWCAPLLKSSLQHKLEIFNMACKQQNTHMVRSSYEH